MKKKSASIVLIVLSFIAVLYGLSLLGVIRFDLGPMGSVRGKDSPNGSPKLTVVRVGVAPYQDATMFLYGMRKGIFRDLGIELDLKSVGWNDQINLVAGDGADIAMATLDEVVAQSRSLNAINKGIAYFLPAWQFNGLSVVCRQDVSSLAELRLKADEADAKRQFVNQLKGKILAIPEGGVFDQAIRAFIKSTGNDPSQFRFVNTPLEAGLNGLSDKSVAIAAIGNNERPEALRRGYKMALDAADMDVIVLTGFITSQKYYSGHRETVDNFARAWFSSLALALANPQENYSTVRQYLSSRGANVVSFDEAMLALTFNRFPQNSLEAKSLFLDTSSRFSWKKCWDLAVENLKNSGKLDQVPADTRDFVAAEVIVRLNVQQ